MSSEIESQIAAGAAAALGVLARAKMWRKTDGSFDWNVAVTELMTAPCLGIVALGIASYWGLNQTITSMMCALFGLLGTAFVSEFAKMILEKFFTKPPGGTP